MASGDPRLWGRRPPFPLEREGESRSLGQQGESWRGGGRGAPWRPHEWEEERGGPQSPPSMEDRGGGSYAGVSSDKGGRRRRPWLPTREEDYEKEEDSWGPNNRSPQETPKQEGRRGSWEPPRKGVGGPPMGEWLRVPLSPPREDSWEPPRKRVRNPPMDGWWRVPLSPPKGRGWTSPNSQRPAGVPSSHVTHRTPTSSTSGRDSPENGGTPPWVSRYGLDGSMGRSRESLVPPWESCREREIPPTTSGKEMMRKDFERSRWLEEPSSSSSRSSRGSSSSRGDLAWERRQRNLENESYSEQSWSGRGLQNSQSQVDSREGDNRGPKGQLAARFSLHTQREVLDTMAPATALYKMTEAAMDGQEGVDPLAVCKLAHSLLSSAGSADQKSTLQRCLQILESIDPRLAPFTTRMTSLNSGDLLYAEDKLGILKGVTRSFPNWPEEPPEWNSDQQPRLQDKISLKLWHRRFGHVDSSAILQLPRNLRRSIKVYPGEAGSTAKCLTCLAVKGDHPSFSQKIGSRSTAMMDLIHCELSGPMNVPSLLLQKYILIFVDDYSRHCVTFLLKETSETHRCFEIYLAEVKKQHKSAPKVFQMNSAADSISPQTLALLGKQGISHKRGVKCISKRSRTAAREMKTLLEMTRCMLADAFLPGPFWGHAIVAATYLWNRLAVSFIRKTPLQAWGVKVPHVNHLRVFGSLVCNRLDPRDPTQHVLVAYSDSQPTYRVMNLETGMFHTKGFLDFDERQGIEKRGSFLATVEWQGYDIEILTSKSVSMTPQSERHTKLAGGETREETNMPGDKKRDGKIEADKPIKAQIPQSIPVLSEQISGRRRRPVIRLRNHPSALKAMRGKNEKEDHSPPLPRVTTSATRQRAGDEEKKDCVPPLPTTEAACKKQRKPRCRRRRHHKTTPVISTQTNTGKGKPLRKRSCCIDRINKHVQNQDEASLELWHRRFGHADSAAILQLQNDKLATRIKIIPGEADSTARCPICRTEKGDRSSFSLETVSRSTALMDLIHCELSGPIDVPTLVLQRYVLIFVDDYSRYCITFLLKETGEIHRFFKRYFTLLKKSHNLEPKAFQMNSAADSISPQTLAFLEAQGILHKKDVECIPGQSRTAEREMKALLEMTRCMLADTNLPTPFWGHAIKTATDLWNRLAVSHVKRTPFEAWFCKVPHVNRLRVFGSLVCDQPEPNDSAQHVFIGYNCSLTKYRVMGLETGEVCTKSTPNFNEGEGIEKRGNFLASLERHSCDIEPLTGTGVSMTPQTLCCDEGNRDKDVKPDQPIVASMPQCSPTPAIEHSTQPANCPDLEEMPTDEPKCSPTPPTPCHLPIETSTSSGGP